MNDLTLPADFSRLLETSADAPASVTLAAPDTDDVGAERARRVLSSLRVRDENGVALPLVIAVKAVSRPGRGVVVSGTAKTVVSPARDANLTVTFDEAGRLDTLVVAPEANDEEAHLTLGTLSGLRVRVEWVCYRPSPDKPRLMSQIQGRISVKNRDVPVRVVTTPEGLWVIDAMRSVEQAREPSDGTADDRGLSGFTVEDLLALGAPADGSKDLVQDQLQAFLALTGRSVGLTVDRLQLGFLPGDREVSYLRCELGFASRLDPWVIIKDKVEVEGVELDLKLHNPDDPRRRYLDGSLAGQIRVGRDARIGFRLSREGERWMLTPRDRAVKVDVRGLVEWMGAPSLAEGVPSWVGEDSAMQLEDMALGIAENESGLARVSLLRGTIAWTRAFDFPALEGKARITKLWAGVEVRDPFLGERREAIFSLGGKASVRVAPDREVECDLCGWIRGGAVASGWSIQAAVQGSLSLTDALDSLVGVALGERSSSLFGDFDLSVSDPTLTIGSRGRFGLDTDVRIQKKPGATSSSFDIGVGKLEFQPAHIAAWRDSDGTRYSLRAGLSIEFDVGPKVEECTLWISHETSGGRRATEVSLCVTAVFPQPAPRPPITIVLQGRYASAKGVSFHGSVSAIALNPVIDEMLRPLGLSLPEQSKGFPALTASDLRLTLDTGSGEYSARGKASASPFTIDTVTICDARFEFKVASSAKKLDVGAPKPPGTGVSLFGAAKVLRKGRAKATPLTGESYKPSDYAPEDFISVALRIEFDGSSSDCIATINGLLLSDFVATFETGLSAPSPADDFKIAALGFRYRTQRPSPVAEGELPAPASAMSFFVDWKRDNADLGRLDFALVKRDERDSSHAMVVARPKLSWLSDAEIGWASESFRDVPLGVAKVPPLSETPTTSAYSFRRGLFLKATFSTRGTFVEKRLGLTDPIRVEVTDTLAVDLGSRGRVVFDVTGKDQPKRLDAKVTSAPTSGDGSVGGSSELASPPPSPAEEEGSKSVRFDTTLSPALILDKLSSSGDGAKPASPWRERLGNSVVLSNIGVTLHTKPKPAVSVFADVGVNVGPWMSVAAKAVAVRLTPASLSADGLKALSVDYDIQGAAIALNLPPWIKGGAAVIKVADPSGLRIVGLGEVQLLKKVRVGALAFARFERNADGYALDAGFGFVFATGFTVPLPPSPVVLTGLAGGFGYGAVPKLPSRAEDVADNALLKLMRGGDADFSAKGMLDKLDSFKRSVALQPGSWCVMFGLTLTLARVVECALLAVVESRREGLEVSLLGLADIALGSRAGAGGSAFGRIQLALLARWSQAAGVVTVLGAITGDSWIFDEKCRLQGGFALCVWYGGAHAGDFLVSLGGYSPFAPKRLHYPALDRVGLRWRVNEALSIYGDAYLTLDRYSLQLGAAAGMSYRTAKVKLEAHFSFDAIVEWAPLYYEARLRVSVHVEIKVAITLRLGLDVDVHLWGPPFGAELHVEVDLWPFNPSFDVALGSNFEEAQFERNNVSFNRVVELAAGAKDASTLRFTSGESPAVLLPDGAKVTSSSRAHRFAAERPCAPDAATVSLETAIPATEVSYEGAGGARFTAGGERGLQVRPKRWQQVRSSLVLAVYELVVRKGAEATRSAAPAPWTLAPVMSQPLESLWSLPQNRERPWDVSRAELITAVTVSPPAVNSGARFDGVALAKEFSHADRSVRIGGAVAPTPTRATMSAVVASLATDRESFKRSLADLGFATGTVARSGFRALEATPLTVNGMNWEVRW